MFNPRVSPDGSHLLATGSSTTNPGLWLASLSRAEFERIETDAIAPLWSPDGAQIAFTARGGFDLLIRPSSGAASRRLISSDVVKILNDWSPSGDHIVYSQRDELTKLDLWGVRVEDGATFPIMRTPYNELQARISPDGRWLAYVADDSGALEVYVQTLPGARRTIQGIGRRRWAAAVAPRSERALLHRAGPRASWPCAMTQDQSHPFGSPRRLFRAPVAGGPDDARDYYAAAADGGRFLSTAHSATATTARSRSS